MSDEAVYTALRSSTPLVTVEAPAGCGKTHQGAEYARELAVAATPGRPLILTHTHAACSVFAARTKGCGARVDIRTIDSVIGQIASAYHAGLGLPADVASWVRREKNGHEEVGLRVARLVDRYPVIAGALARRHPVVICDEHQDSSGDQHAIAMALHRQGAQLRIFADPMQKIFRQKPPQGAAPPCDWDALCAAAGESVALGHPHRWENGCQELGAWTLAARSALKAGNPIDLRTGVPVSVRLVFAENKAQTHDGFQIDSVERRPIDALQKQQASLLVLTRQPDVAASVRAAFGGAIALWEGHTRYALDRLVIEMTNAAPGDRAAFAAAFLTFMDGTGVGFSPTAFGKRLLAEVAEGCAKKTTGKPALIQSLARPILDDPSHRGVAATLQRVLDLKAACEPLLASVRTDCEREFREAIGLGRYPTPDDGLADITHRRTHARPIPPPRAVSTIYKAKGLECGSVIVLPCDKKTFPDKHDARCLLYVALSRATSQLMLVLSRQNPSPLFILPPPLDSARPVGRVGGP